MTVAQCLAEALNQATCFVGRAGGGYSARQNTTAALRFPTAAAGSPHSVWEDRVMKTLLLCGGVYGEERGLDWLRRIVEAGQPEGIPLAGGVLKQGRPSPPRFPTLCL